jgi:hypothetical protein
MPASLDGAGLIAYTSTVPFNSAVYFLGAGTTQ